MNYFDPINASSIDLSDLGASGVLTINPAWFNKVPLTDSDATIAGNWTINGLLNVDNLSLDGNIISATNTNGSLFLQPKGTGGVYLGDLASGSFLALGQNGTSTLNRHFYIYSGVTNKYLDLYVNADTGCGLTGAAGGSMAIAAGHILNLTAGNTINLTTAANCDMAFTAGGLLRIKDKDTTGNPDRVSIDSATSAISSITNTGAIPSLINLVNNSDSPSAGSAIQFAFGSGNTLGAKIVQGYDTTKGQYLAFNVGATEVLRLAQNNAIQQGNSIRQIIRKTGMTSGSAQDIFKVVTPAVMGGCAVRVKWLMTRSGARSVSYHREDWYSFSTSATGVCVSSTGIGSGTGVASSTDFSNINISAVAATLNIAGTADHRFQLNPTFAGTDTTTNADIVAEIELFYNGYANAPVITVL